MELIKDFSQWIEHSSIDIQNKANIGSICLALENMSSNSQFIVSQNRSGTIFLRKADSEILLYFTEKEEVSKIVSYLKITQGKLPDNN